MKVKRIESEFLSSNTFVVCEGNECIIIDAGVAPQKLFDEIGNKKVVGVLLTHGHYDHVFYAEEFFNKFKCPIFISKEGLKTATDKTLNYGEGFYIKNPKIFTVFENEKELYIGEFNVKIIFTPGHCPGCVCYKIENSLFAGDTLFKTGIGRCDLKNSNEKDMLESLKKIQNIKFEMLYSGHGEESTYDEQQRNLKGYIRFLERKF